MERISRRRPVIAFLLSILLPGLGHVYNGHFLRGLLFFGGFWLLLSAMGLAGLISGMTGLICFVATAIGGQILVATLAAIEASGLKDTQLKWYNRWYVYVCVVLLVHIGLEPVLLYAQTDLVGLRTFRVPSASMSPALKSGDYFVAKLERHGVKHPERGDVVIFPFPEDTSKTFVMRIIGLPGERIQIKNKAVFINDRRVDDPWGGHLSAATLPESTSPRDFFGPITVPEGAVFVLGDNRDYSLDSRFWGFVSTREILGKALFLYWSDDRSRIGKRLGQS